MSKHISIIMGLMCMMAMESLQEQGISWGRKGEDQAHHRSARTDMRYHYSDFWPADRFF